MTLDILCFAILLITYLSLLNILGYKVKLFNLMHREEGLQELISSDFILGHVEERLLCLVIGEELQLESVDAEPVRHPQTVVMVSLLLSQLSVNIIINYALLYRARGHLEVKSSQDLSFLLSRLTWAWLTCGTRSVLVTEVIEEDRAAVSSHSRLR